MLIGAAASGKSTAAQKLAVKYDAVIISTDRMRAALYGNESIQGNWPQIERLIYIRIGKLINFNKNIILDSTHYKKEYRAKIIKNFAKCSIFSAYYFNYPFSLIYNAKRIIKIISAYI